MYFLFITVVIAGAWSLGMLDSILDRLTWGQRAGLGLLVYVLCGALDSQTGGGGLLRSIRNRSAGMAELVERCSIYGLVVMMIGTAFCLYWYVSGPLSWLLIAGVGLSMFLILNPSVSADSLGVIWELAAELKIYAVWIAAGLLIVLSLYMFQGLPWPVSWLPAVGIALGTYCSLKQPAASNGTPIVCLKGMKWVRRDFCRGWLITGDTGSGKTTSGINQLLYQVFANEPKWGGVCIDDKGSYWQTLERMAKHFGRQDDLILLKVRPDGAPSDWQPAYWYNIISEPGIIDTTLAKFIVDTASCQGQTEEQSFFKTQAQTHIGRGIEALRAIGADVTLDNVHELLLNPKDTAHVVKELENKGKENLQYSRLAAHFRSRYLSQPPEQLAGVSETIANYLNPFLTPEIAQIFCSPTSNFSMADMDRGKIICLCLPQKYQLERRYLNTFLKMIFYYHVLRRYDARAEQRDQNNLLVLWADEAQRFVTASPESLNESNVADTMREANATIVASAQSISSFIPPLGRAITDVFLLNLCNRMIFKSADQDCAISSANFLGKHPVLKKSWGYSGGKQTTSFREAEEYWIPPHELRQLPKHHCVLVHCESRFKKVTLPPIEPDGRISPWYRKWGWW